MGNEVVWDLSKGGFYEVYYFTVNHEASGSSFWFRSTLLETGDPSKRGALWLARFSKDNPSQNFATHKYFDENQVSFRPGQLDLAIGNSMLAEGKYTADWEADGHKFSWDLKYTPHPETLWLIPEAIKKTRIPKADVNVPNVDIKLYGSLTIDDEVFEFDGNLAGQAHHWGYHYAHSWIWGHCNEFENAEGCWAEVLAVKLFDLGDYSLPFVMIRTKTDSGEFGITKPLQLLKARSHYKNGKWIYSFIDGSYKIELELSAKLDDFVVFPYISPHGDHYWCHNSCLCDCDLRIFELRNGSWMKIEELHSSQKAAAEFCSAENTTPGDFEFRNTLKPKF